MKLISNKTDLRGMDCHVHSSFSPDSDQSPQEIVDAVRSKGLRGFIITDHIDIGHWEGCKPIDFDEYFRVWSDLRSKNPDLMIYIGLEVGFEKVHAEKTRELIEPLPLEYVVNSVHYWEDRSTISGSHFALGKQFAYGEYIDAVAASLDAPYPFNTVGHFGFIERYAPQPPQNWEMRYGEFKDKMDLIIDKAIKRDIRFEENTNSCGCPVFRLPREEFLRAYAAAGGNLRPVTSSDAHISFSVGHDFDKAEKFISDIFGK